MGRSDARLKEAAKLGFKRAITAPPRKSETRNDNSALPSIAIKTLIDLVNRVEQATEGSGESQNWAA